jgi:membrane-associated phospholipid phosphatase
VLDAMLRLRTPLLDTLVTYFTDLGGPIGMTILATLATAALALTRRSWTPVVLMATATAGSLLMTSVGKALVGRVRPPLADAVPPLETSASFPSGHSLNAVVVAGVVAYLVVQRQARRAARAWTVALAAAFSGAIGLSRVFLGHHWLTDVLVAWALGLGWLAVVVTGHRLWLTTRALTRALPPRPSNG